jgi:membrane associated rhomboid family serine protease
MFIPLYDGKPIKHISLQWVTLTIIGLNVAVYLMVNVLDSSLIGDLQYISLSLGHIPSIGNDLKTLPAEYQLLSDDYYFVTMLTSAFIHADLIHLAGNMIFVWVFGDNVEDALGHIKFIIFYVLCAVAAVWFHGLVFADSDGPLIGASGAAAGLVTAYLLLHPKMKIWGLVLFRIPLRLPAYIALGGWVAYQFIMFLIDSDGQISWASHVGGALTGALLVVVLKRRAVPLFDREVVLPNAVELKPEASLPPEVKQSPWGRG